MSNLPAFNSVKQVHRTRKMKQEIGWGGSSTQGTEKNWGRGGFELDLGTPRSLEYGFALGGGGGIGGDCPVVWSEARKQRKKSKKKTETGVIRGGGGKGCWVTSFCAFGGGKGEELQDYNRNSFQWSNNNSTRPSH